MVSEDAQAFHIRQNTNLDPMFMQTRLHLSISLFNPLNIEYSISFGAQTDLILVEIAKVQMFPLLQ